MIDLGRAVSVAPAGQAEVIDHVRLDYDGRFLRRKRLVTTGGATLTVDLAQMASLADGDALILEDGRAVGVIAAEEPLIEVRGAELARLAWHIGNRHTPCRIEPDRLLIRDDPVLADMLVRLGAALVRTRAPFVPEGGAYGLGRTMGHAHGPAPDHDHPRPGPHDHKHDHPHSHHDHG
ncbi:urease accessory protein UreE [Tropicimonas sp. IMCC34043]|uniref:urease accessory protein UreE n=1 Tax=Tropicimonas sp. IMCC34043 TaxID=2248760 RepID=UPI000E255E2F|nr:urease accessory protein UreE [Tropicimonas sp. IMCC34043]